jgi:sporulation protein YlmC with PRC-barrel domain
MKKTPFRIPLTTLALAAALGGASPAWAQVAGGTTVENVTVTAMTQLAMGWSVKKTLLGKTIYNDAGEKVGKVDDLIISPDRDVSFVIVGAGGFIGIGRHDVAIPVTQIKNQAGKLVMAGATKDMIKAMPPFTYATDTAERDRFIATAEADIKAGKAKVVELEKKGSSAATDAKAKIDQQITTLQGDLKAAESKLAEMKKATAVRWKEFEASVGAATARVRKSIDSATG